LGYSGSELLQKTFQDITHPDDLGEDLNNVKKLLQGEVNSYNMKKRYLCIRLRDCEPDNYSLFMLGS
jgi:PAS domain S-box-containing protein